MNCRFLLVIVCSFASAVCGQTPNFTYQGHLTTGSNPATGLFDMRFAVYDSANGSNQIGLTSTNNSVYVQGGIFTTIVNPGQNVFTGGDRWLEISVATNSFATFSTLSPRTLITPTPYAIAVGNSINEVLKVPSETPPIPQNSYAFGGNNSLWWTTFQNAQVPNNGSGVYGGYGTNRFFFEKRSKDRSIKDLKFMVHFFKTDDPLGAVFLRFEIWGTASNTFDDGFGDLAIYTTPQFRRSVTSDVSLPFNGTVLGQWNTAVLLNGVDTTVHSGEFLVAVIGSPKAEPSCNASVEVEAIVMGAQ